SYSGWITDGGLRPAHDAAGSAEMSYLINANLEAHFRPRQPTDGRPVPVIASPDVARAAGPDGLIPIQIIDQRVVGQVVATARRFPTLGDSFVVADESWLYTALNGPEPRAGLVTEVWVDGGSSPHTVATALGRRPFDRLQLSSRAQIQSALAR